MKKFYSKKVLIAFSALSVFCVSQAAFGDNTPPAQNGAVSCGEVAYRNKIDDINAFNKWEYGFAIVPMGVGGTMIYIGAQGGAAPLVEGGAGLLAVGGAAYGVIKLPKYIRAKGYVEVDNNLNEALGTKAGDKALAHTEDLIRNKTHDDALTVDQVAKAIREAAAAGDLCQNGKLVTKEDFRQVVIAHLQGVPVSPEKLAKKFRPELNPESKQSSSSISEVKCCDPAPADAVAQATSASQAGGAQ